MDSDMNSNIEPGCLAMIVSHPVNENNGKVVTVGRCLGEIPSDAEDDYRWVGTRWEIDRAIHAYCQQKGGASNVYAKHIAEICLMRIDGYAEPVTEQKTLEKAL